MTDFYFSESGDIRVSPHGDIAVTDTPWRDDAQQAYIRIKTEPGDYLLYRGLGAEMSRLYGMPQSESTGNYGVDIINAALQREGRFVGKSVSVKSVPTGPQTIRFDVFIQSGSRSSLILSLEQNLGVTQ